MPTLMFTFTPVTSLTRLNAITVNDKLFENNSLKTLRFENKINLFAFYVINYNSKVLSP